MAGNIFISYRRDDDPGFAYALYLRLEQEFPGESLFMDVEGQIKPGDDFVAVLSEQVARCDGLLAIIGERWIGATDRDGNLRLEKEDGFVRIESASILRQGCGADSKRRRAHPMVRMPAKPTEGGGWLSNLLTRAAREGAQSPPQSADTASPAAIRPVRVLKSGMIDDVAYTLYSDGSIETSTRDSVGRFASIDEFRQHLEKRARRGSPKRPRVTQKAVKTAGDHSRFGPN
jgi:hypothetical protein